MDQAWSCQLDKSEGPTCFISTLLSQVEQDSTGGGECSQSKCKQLIIMQTTRAWRNFLALSCSGQKSHLAGFLIMSKIWLRFITVTICFPSYPSDSYCVSCVFVCACVFVMVSEGDLNGIGIGETTDKNKATRWRKEESEGLWREEGRKKSFRLRELEDENNGENGTWMSLPPRD